MASWPATARQQPEPETGSRAVAAILDDVIGRYDVIGPDLVGGGVDVVGFVLRGGVLLLFLLLFLVLVRVVGVVPILREGAGRRRRRGLDLGSLGSEELSQPAEGGARLLLRFRGLREVDEGLERVA